MWSPFARRAVLIGCATVAGCGDQLAPRPDRERPRALVEDFFTDEGWRIDAFSLPVRDGR
jgi:hypothetical protein